MGRPTNEQKAARAAAEQERINLAVKGALAEHTVALRKEVEADVIAQLEAIKGSGLPTPVEPTAGMDNKSFAQHLAMQIAEIANQGIGKPAPIPPETLERWRSAHAEMTALLVTARERGEDAHYRVTKTMFLNETRVEPQWFNQATKTMEDMLIRWNDIPNEWMEPVNPIARDIHSAYMLSIGNTVSKRNDDPTPWVRSDKRLFVGMSPEQRAQRSEGNFADPRLAGRGSNITKKSTHILGTVAQPAVVT
jgi:hypothetical protein